MRGLRDHTRARILEVLKSLAIPEGPGAVLLCDKLALRAISAACRVSEIMDEGITLVEAIENERQPLRDLAAVYMITPTVESINHMLDDFKDPRNPKYGDVHILFTSHLPDSLMGKIKASGLVARVKTFREINFEYLAFEAQAFTLDSPDALVHIFSPSSQTAVPEQHKIASQLTTLFAQQGEMPYVRFAAKGHPSSSALAHLVVDKLERLGATTGCFSRSKSRGDRPTLLIVDRTVDVLAPLLHEYSYQAMIQDLLPITDGERYSYRFTSNRGEELKKDVLLNETDPLWPTLRHMHIADCIEHLTTNFNTFIASNQSAARLGKQQAGNLGLKEMSEALRGMPQYQEEMQRYSLHISVTRELMARFKQNQLEAISTLEQNMAVGEDADGKEVKGSRLVEALLDMVQRDISPVDKMRLLMTYIISQEGIQDQDRRRLVEAAQLTPEDQTAIVNLFYLGVTLSRGAGKGVPRRKPPVRSKPDDGAGYELSRYTPALKKVAEDVLTGTAALSDYPYVKDRPSAGIGLGDVGVALGGGGHPEPSWASRGRTKKEENVMHGPKLVVFVIGGLAHSELKCGYELTKAHQREVLMGSTSMLTPFQFITSLKQMKKLPQAFADP